MLLGVLGLGRMGLPIHDRLVTAGFDVAGRDILTRPEPLGPVDVLITVLPGAAETDTEAVLALAPGSLWIDLTSNDPRVAADLAELAAAQGIDTVGAPMAGGVTAARDGTLKFYVGGTPDAVARARPVLEILGVVEVVGPRVGDGYTAKLLANLLWFGQAVAVSEALLLGQSLGLQPGALRDLLAASAGGSVFIGQYVDSLLEGDYLEDFGIDRVVEELDTLASLATQQGVPFELSTLVARLHREALERFGAVPGELLAAKLLEERAGRTLRGQH